MAPASPWCLPAYGTSGINLTGVDYQNGGAMRIDETGMKLNASLTGIAVKIFARLKGNR